MITRIIVVLLVSLVHSSLALAQAQPMPIIRGGQTGRDKVARIGYLAFGYPPRSALDFSPIFTPRGPFGTDTSDNRNTEAFYQGLREVGYIEGKNLIIEYRHAQGKSERFPELTAELVSSKVDLIVAPTTPAIRGARQATTTIPIVTLSIGDLVTEGIIDSLAQPASSAR
jgi:hypothetical protein